jgi:hypothetical protein
MTHHILRRVTNITFALLLAVMSVNLSGVMSLNVAAANNGTLKVHEQGTPSDTESNDPKVCIFNFEGFDFDQNQTGLIKIEPQGGGNPATTDTAQLLFGPANASGYAQTSYLNDGMGDTLDNGHYKSTLYGKDINGNYTVDLKAKSKVFKIECATPPTSVTATAPTNIDPCGTVNDTYIIPTTTGVNYQINGQTVAANTYPGTGSVTITAVAQAGYVLQGTATWTFTFTNADCPVTATPPTKVDLCGTTNDTYTIPITPGVTYKVNGITKSAGTYNVTALQYIFGVTITAHATSGNVLQGTSSWTFNYSAQPCSVTPADPTKDDVCGKSNDKYTIPSTAHVKYYVNGVYKPAGTYSAPSAALIVAVADPGYVIPFGTQAIWLFVFTNTACPVSVTPTAPTQTDVCGTTNDTYTIPATTGVVYKVNGVVTPAGTYPATASVLITAEAAPSYVLAGANSWNFDFTNVACPIVPCTPTMVSALVLSQITNSNNCPPGMGGGGTPSVVTTTTTYPTPTELPQTGPEASSTFAKLFMVAAAGIVTYGVMFFLVNRRDLAKK